MSMQDFIDTLNEQQKKALLEALTGSIYNSEEKNQPEKENTPKANENDFVMNKQQSYSGKRKEPVKAKQNQWVDTGEFKDVTTPEISRTPRNRPAPKKVKTNCHVCGRNFDADSRFVFGEFHRCDRCN
jgi:hypothetical protein